MQHKLNANIWREMLYITFDTHADLRVEPSAVTAEQHPLATVYQQDNLVRHVGGQLQRQRTPVDEIVFIRQS